MSDYTTQAQQTGILTAAGQSYEFETDDFNAGWFAISGTFTSATATVEGYNDADMQWHSLRAWRYTGVQFTGPSTLTALQPIYFTSCGFKKIRLRLAGLASGAVSVSGIASKGGINDISNAMSVDITSRTVSAATGISTFHHLISAASTNATSVKTSAGVITSMTLSNNAATHAYFKLYNKASAPTVGTDTPIKTIMIPANQTLCINYDVEERLTAGIAYALTTGMAIADATAVTATQISVSIVYA